MLAVPRSQTPLVALARALVGAESAAHLGALLGRSRPRIRGAAPATLRLLEDTLARGSVLALLGMGAWRPAAHLSEGSVVRGRSWELHPELGLRFSRLSFELLSWLLAEEPPALAAQELELGDQLLICLALDRIRFHPAAKRLARQGVVRAAPLAWVLYPDLLATEGPPPPSAPAFYATLCRGRGALLLEAMQLELERRWLRQERAKAELADLRQMAALGAAQEAVLSGLLAALDQAGRWELAEFVVGAAAALLADRPPAGRWIRKLRSAGTLQQRSEARRGAAAFLRALDLLAQWTVGLRAVRFFEEGYPAAELWLSLWERLGEQGMQAARDRAQALESWVEGEGP